MLEQIHALGAQVVAVVVDSPERNAAMQARWGIPYPILSDPDGTRWLRSSGLWNADERGGIAIGATLVFDAAGNEVFRSQARDFADRLTDEPAIESLRALCLPSLQGVVPWVPAAVAESDSPGFRSEQFGTYFRGYFYGCLSIERRATDPASKAEATAAKDMATGMLDAWKAWQARL
jgi:AhpC/TSA family